MTPVVRSARKRHGEAGSLAEELPYWAWVDERTLLTRRGELVTLAALWPAGIAGQGVEPVDTIEDGGNPAKDVAQREHVR